MKKLLLLFLIAVTASVYSQNQEIYFTTFPQNNPPSGWEKEILLGEYNWYFGEIVLPGSTLFSEPAAVFNDDITGEQGNEAVLNSPLWNVSGYETVWLSYEYGINRAGGGGILTVEVFDGSDWQEVAKYDETQAPTTIEPIDVTQFKNAAFSVRFNYFDEFSFAMGAGITNFKLEGTYSVAPNSECWNAVVLNCDASGEGSTINSTIKDELPTHGTLNPNGSYGVWYKYSDIGNQSDVTFSLCETDAVFDSKVIVYQGACADLFPIASNDDECGTYSEVTFHNDGSSTYYILVFGAEESTSDFNYNFTCLSGAPANDDIENAINVTDMEMPYIDPAVPLINATMEADSADFFETGCDMGGGWYPNVFYKFTAAQNGTATATFTTPNEGGFQIIGFYSAPNENATIADLTFVAQETNPCNQMSETKAIEITAGATYYVVMMRPYTNSDVVINLEYETIGDEGCLTSEFGQYPEGIFTPNCVGIVERITEIGWAGEYSKVQVSAGTEYIFSSSVETDFITIADENGEVVFTTGTGLVTWTSPVDQIIRFYNHADENCSSEEVSRTRGVQCGEVPVYDPCDPVHIGGADMAIGFSNGFVVANDINVLTNTQFSVEKITLEVATMEGEPTTFSVAFYEGESGVETPYGDTFENLIPTSITENGLFGLIPKYTVELTLPTPQVLTASADADKKYWVSIASAFDVTGGFTYWVSSAYTSTDTLPVWQLQLPIEEEEPIWIEYADEFGGTFEGVMSIKGECEELGLSDLNPFDFTFYPNPVKNILNISSKKLIENVLVFNLAGQQVLNVTKVFNGEINLNSLNPGTYLFKVTLENGQIETFKIIKK